MVASEAVPFAKTGGLADVVGALPRALVRLGHDVDLVMPRYRGMLPATQGTRLPVPLGSRSADAAVFSTTLSGFRTVFIDHPVYFDREYLYGAGGQDYPDNPERFAFLARASLEWASSTGTRYNVVHAHDWQAGLVPVLLRSAFASHPTLGGTPTVFTIHNLAYQGLFPRDNLGRIGAPDYAFQMDGVEFYGQLSFLKAGLYHASHVTTVSDTYAREITTTEGGCGLDGLLRTRAAQGRLTGILNGIDESWDPRTDPHLATPFEADDWKGKRANADEVRKQFGMAVSRGPLFAIVSRLVHQKGIDLSLAAAESIVAEGGQLVVIGQGEGRFEEALRDLAGRHPDNVGVHVGFRETEARRIFAGSDFLLMPSRFEPCGLAQMYAQRFGSLPIVRRTGGLNDTVEDGVTGFTFADASPRGLTSAIARAFEAFGQKKRLNAMRRTAMSREFGWDRAALNYCGLYSRAFGNNAARRWKAA